MAYCATIGMTVTCFIRKGSELELGGELKNGFVIVKPATFGGLTLTTTNGSRNANEDSSIEYA